jgi:hypothetical protein
MVAEGDLVVVHSHLTLKPGDRGSAVVDIFRIENGKIAEHWDVLQEVPEKSANHNTMFWSGRLPFHCVQTPSYPGVCGFNPHHLIMIY